MRIPRPVLLLLALPLAAAPALRLVAVERRGLPPFEDDRRVYRLEGEEASRLRPGEVVQLVRPGDPRDPGRLKVSGFEGGRASATLERRGVTYPLIGDEALVRRVAQVPALPASRTLPDLSVRSPKAVPPPEPPPKPTPAAHAPAPAVHAAPVAHAKPAPEAHAVPAHPAPVHATPVPHAAPATRASIYFLEGDGSLSPKGREKVVAAVHAGSGGAWILGVPGDLVLPEKVRQARIQAVRRALSGAGASRVTVREVPRRDGDFGDVVYLLQD